MPYNNILSRIGKILDIKHDSEYVEYNPDWVRKELKSRLQDFDIPKHVSDTLENGWYSTLPSRFDIFHVKKFKERLIIASVTPTGEAYGSNCFGTSLYLGGLIPSDILIDGKMNAGKGFPGIEDYLERINRANSLDENAIIVYYDKGIVCHSVFWERERKEFFDRGGIWRPLRGYKSSPKSDSLEVVIFNASKSVDFGDLFSLSFKDAYDCISASHASEE
ncbi:hypothetical protein COU54_01775 [Candidatus Pacearchaeota archaeon CG10_big_fil_rev_8_21_14_0_10_31_24]|nr:MAG: hypothetical protein COU54_01775 [Candidatus Pacearchaeota archaeon CG10_big_fil_rev_8_21_14_0_10_31_24]